MPHQKRRKEKPYVFFIQSPSSEVKTPSPVKRTDEIALPDVARGNDGVLGITRPRMHTMDYTRTCLWASDGQHTDWKRTGDEPLTPRCIQSAIIPQKRRIRELKLRRKRVSSQTEAGEYSVQMSSRQEKDTPLACHWYGRGAS